MDNWYIVWAIAAKDILDAIKNRIIVSQIVAVTVILLTVKGLGLVIQNRFDFEGAAARINHTGNFVDHALMFNAGFINPELHFSAYFNSVDLG